MKKAALILLIILTVGILIWFWYPIRSMAVMSVYSAIHENNSIMAKKGFKIDIPGGLSTSKRDWSPFVITFNAENFNGRPNKGARMSIMYNFPAFDPKTRTNIFYELDSSYCSAFYGAYAIETNDGVPYGYDEEGNLDFDEILYAFKYDYVNLVLESLGNYDFRFNVLDYTAKSVNYIESDGWMRIDAEILTNSVVHNFTGSQRSYLQYGRPLKDAENDFEEIKIFGRLYLKYFPEYNSTIVMYAMAPDINIVDDCDTKILSKSKIIKYH